MSKINEQQVAQSTVDRVINADQDEQAELAELYARERAHTAEEMGSEESKARWDRAAESIADRARDQDG